MFTDVTHTRWSYFNRTPRTNTHEEKDANTHKLTHTHTHTYRHKSTIVSLLTTPNSKVLPWTNKEFNSDAIEN